MLVGLNVDFKAFFHRDLCGSFVSEDVLGVLLARL